MNLLSVVGGVIPEFRNTTGSPSNQRQVGPLQPVPVGRFRPGRPEPVEEADGGRVHGRSPGGFVTYAIEESQTEK